MQIPFDHPNLETLFTRASALASEMLAQHGEFYPFAMLMDAEGQVLVDASQPDEERPDPGSVLDDLVNRMATARGQGQISSSAVVINVTVKHPADGETVDAVQIILDHLETAGIDVFVPYGEAAIDTRQQVIVSRRSLA